MENTILYSLGEIVEGIVIKRPSKICKTPYMADVKINNEEDELLVHSPSLGCCGLVDPNARIIMTPNENPNTKSTHRAQLSYYCEGSNSVIVGVNPKLSEIIVEKALQKNYIKNLTNVNTYKREVKMLNSRFDFAGIDNNGKPFVLEVKTVPLADYVDMTKKEKRKYLKENKKEIEKIPFSNKIAYFPDGYRKSGDSIVSPRALKHIQELEEIATKSETRALLCFVIQREDASSFQPSNIDPIYKEAVIKAHNNGVEIITLQVKWDNQGVCYYVTNDLPINLH